MVRSSEPENRLGNSLPFKFFVEHSLMGPVRPWPPYSRGKRMPARPASNSIFWTCRSRATPASSSSWVRFPQDVGGRAGDEGPSSPPRTHTPAARSCRCPPSRARSYRDCLLLRHGAETLPMFGRGAVEGPVTAVADGGIGGDRARRSRRFHHGSAAVLHQLTAEIADERLGRARAARVRRGRRWRPRPRRRRSPHGSPRARSSCPQTGASALDRTPRPAERVASECPLDCHVECGLHGADCLRCADRDRNTELPFNLLDRQPKLADEGSGDREADSSNVTRSKRRVVSSDCIDFTETPGVPWGTSTWVSPDPVRPVTRRYRAQEADSTGRLTPVSTSSSPSRRMSNETEPSWSFGGGSLRHQVAIASPESTSLIAGSTRRLRPGSTWPPPRRWSQPAVPEGRRDARTHGPPATSRPSLARLWIPHHAPPSPGARTSPVPPRDTSSRRQSRPRCHEGDEARPQGQPRRATSPSSLGRGPSSGLRSSSIVVLFSFMAAPSARTNNDRNAWSGLETLLVSVRSKYPTLISLSGGTLQGTGFRRIEFARDRPLGPGLRRWPVSQRAVLNGLGSPRRDQHLTGNVSFEAPPPEKALDRPSHRGQRFGSAGTTLPYAPWTQARCSASVSVSTTPDRAH